VIAGHFGFAAAVKGAERRTPLWALMLATVWLDIIFVPLYLAHIETLHPVPNAPRAYGGNIIHADYTHSLIGALLLSALLGLGAAALWSRRAGFVVGLVSFSHWLLDLVVHRADMPILPGNLGHLPRLGFGLWRYPDAAAAVELALVLGGAWLYWRASRSVSLREGRSLARAITVSLLIAGCGALVLGLDFFS
jgi:hypothetical protein